MSYPDPERRGLLEAELASVTAETAKRVRDLAADIDSMAWRDGCTWYFDAHEWCANVAREHGYSVHDVAFALAVLSPMNRWDQNKLDLIDMIQTMECGALPLGVDRALDILHNGNSGYDVAGGRKVRSFGYNIAHPLTSLDVTIDTWMVQALGIETRYIQRSRVYDAIAQGFRDVADEYGVLPHQLQAAIWIAHRGRKD